MFWSLFLGHRDIAFHPVDAGGGVTAKSLDLFPQSHQHYPTNASSPGTFHRGEISMALVLKAFLGVHWRLHLFLQHTSFLFLELNQELKQGLVG